MNGIEQEASIFSHAFARNTDDEEIKMALARIRYIEQQQQFTVNWFNPADQSILETTLGFEQVAIDLTAYLARHEPDPYVKEVFDFGLLEDFDHLYRYSQFYDLVEGGDPDDILQGKTDIFPGRPTQDHHNDPALRLRQHYQKTKAHPLSKANILTLLAGEQQTNNFYKNVGGTYGGPDLRRLYAEIGQVEEEHVSMYESLMDPNETWLEKWVLHEFTEASNYHTCYNTESDPRIKAIWELFLRFELEHLRVAGELLKKKQGIDPKEVVGDQLFEPSRFEENKKYVADVLERTSDDRLTPDKKLAKIDTLPKDWPSFAWQKSVNKDGSPSETAVLLHIESCGQELVRADKALASRAPEFRTKSLDSERAPNTVPKAA